MTLRQVTQSQSAVGFKNSKISYDLLKNIWHDNINKWYFNNKLLLLFC